jgi:hypothetical protein
MSNKNQPDKPTGRTTPREAQKGGQGAIAKGEAQRQFDRDQSAGDKRATRVKASTGNGE